MIIKTKKIYVPYLLMIGNGFFEFVIEINLRIKRLGIIEILTNLSLYIYLFIDACYKLQLSVIQMNLNLTQNAY